jgi:hypothetical protein
MKLTCLVLLTSLLFFAQSAEKGLHPNETHHCAAPDGGTSVAVVPIG